MFHPTATLLLRGAKVLPEFRDVVFDQANRRGVSVNELILTAAAEHLAERGVKFAGVFEPGDLDRSGAR